MEILFVCVCFWLGIMHHKIYCFHHSAGLPLLGIDSVVNFFVILSIRVNYLLGLLEPCLFGRLCMSVVANTCTLLLQSTEKHLSKQQKHNNNHPSQENNTKKSYNFNRFAPLPQTPKLVFLDCNELPLPSK
jgi:hypothetical protein